MCQKPALTNIGKTRPIQNSQVYNLLYILGFLKSPPRPPPASRLPVPRKEVRPSVDRRSRVLFASPSAPGSDREFSADSGAMIFTEAFPLRRVREPREENEERGRGGAGGRGGVGRGC